MGKSRLLDCISICNAYWTLTVVLGSFTSGIAFKNLNYFSYYCPGGYTIGAKPNWIAWVAPMDMSSGQNPTRYPWVAEFFLSACWRTTVLYTCIQIINMRYFLPRKISRENQRSVPEFIDPVFAKTSPKRSFFSDCSFNYIARHIHI
jgi:hypothetical protein